RVELVDPRQSLPSRVGIALVRRRLQAAALLARPLEPAGVAQTPLELVGKLEQVGDVLARVAHLLGRQRAGIPARVARGLADSQTQDRAQQIGVAGLRAAAGE